MMRRWIIAGVAVAIVGVLAALPFSLRHVGFFRVRQVELVGVRYLAPDSVLAALALREDENVFDDLGAIARRVTRLGGVVSVDVERKLPGTLRVSIVEQVPVAFAPGAERLVALDGEGKTLPYDPAATGLDLPIINRADTVLARALSVVRLADSALFQDVDGARRNARGGVTMDFGSRHVLFAGIPQPEEVRAVGAVRRHLATTGRRYEELDARFDGWVVVQRMAT